MQRDIHLSWFFEHPVEDVWDFLTKPELMGQWFMKNDFKPEVGHKFQFRDKPKKAVGWDGIVYCEVLEIIPLKKISFRWQGGPDPGVISMDTVVTWTLVKAANGTSLTLDHTGFRGLKNYMSSFFMEKGWNTNMRKKFARVLSAYTHEQL
jgi:uncharacterized protein YndB with AHSA1/START domain